MAPGPWALISGVISEMKEGALVWLTGWVGE